MNALRLVGKLALALLAAIVSVQCTQSKSVADDSSDGPRILLDSSALAEARHNRRLLDSALRDTLAKASDKEFLNTIRSGRVLGVQEVLARLGYGVTLTGEIDDQTRDAVKAFERHHGLPQNGDPDSPALEVAINYVDRQTLNTFGLPSLEVWTSNWNATNGAVRAKGTWASADPPRQTTEIWCFRHDKTCHESFAYLLGEELYVGTIDYDVDRWDDDELIARSVDLCFVETLTINRANKSATLIRGSRNEGKELCQKLVRTKSDNTVLRLVDGPGVADSLNRQAVDYFRLGPKAAAWFKKLRDSSYSHSRTPP